jgi:hypothetical protein
VLLRIDEDSVELLVIELFEYFIDETVDRFVLTLASIEPLNVKFQIFFNVIFIVLSVDGVAEKLE